MMVICDYHCTSGKGVPGMAANGYGPGRNGLELSLSVKDSGLTIVSDQLRNETSEFVRRLGKEVVLGHSTNMIRPVKRNGTARDFPGKHVPIASSRPSGNQAATGRVATENKNGKGKFGNSSGSWADKVRISSRKSRFSLDSGFAQEHGQTEYTLPDELIEENFDEWTRCLVGFIPGSSFPFHAVRTIAQKEWKFFGLESVSTYEDFFLFHFHSEEKVHEILTDGPWLFGGKFMMLQQWHACFVFDQSKITKVPVWIRLKGMPFTLWSHKALSFMASIIGKPLSCDRATHEKSRLSYARVCVEVDANKPYVHTFDLKCKLSNVPISIGVEYEWKPQRCPRCCVYGHNCEAGKIVEENAKDEHMQRNTWHMVLSDVPGSRPSGINKEESARANDKGHSAHIKSSVADLQKVHGRVLGFQENGYAIGAEGTPSPSECTIVAPPGMDNAAVIDTMEERPAGRLDEGSLRTTSGGQCELNDIREELLSTDCAKGEQKQKEAGLIIENYEAQKMERLEDGMATKGANPKEYPLIEILDGHCRLNSTTSPGSSKENGLITPESKSNSFDKKKTIASLDGTLTLKTLGGKANMIDKGKASASSGGLLDSKGFWADKVRKSSQNEDFSDNLEGGTSNVDFYNLRPQRPKRKSKMKRGPRPPN